MIKVLSQMGWRKRFFGFRQVPGGRLAEGFGVFCKSLIYLQKCTHLFRQHFGGSLAGGLPPIRHPL